MYSLVQKLIRVFPQADFSAIGDNITYKEDSSIKPTKKEIEDKWESTQYQRTRAPLYPDIGDQLDDLYKKGAFSDEMAAKIKKVKDDNPKPS